MSDNKQRFADLEGRNKETEKANSKASSRNSRKSKAAKSAAASSISPEQKAYQDARLSLRQYRRRKEEEMKLAESQLKVREHQIRVDMLQMVEEVEKKGLEAGEIDLDEDSDADRDSLDLGQNVDGVKREDRTKSWVENHSQINVNDCPNANDLDTGRKDESGPSRGTEQIRQCRDSAPKNQRNDFIRNGNTDGKEQGNTIILEDDFIKNHNIPRTHKTWIDDIPDGEVEPPSESRHLSVLAFFNRKFPVFGGAETDWPEFAAKFKNRVHDNPGLTNTQRLEMLEQCLGSHPKGKVAGYLHDGNYYGKAMKVLQATYGNPARVVSAWTRRIKSFPNVRSNRDLLEFGTKVSQLVQIFESQGFSQDLQSLSLLEELRDKIPSSMQESWGRFVAKRGRGLANVRLFLEWLNEKEDALRHGGQLDNITVSKVSSSYETVDTVEDADIAICSTSARNKISCQFCMKEHFLDQCPEFDKKSNGEKLKWFRDERRCFLCTKPGHGSRSCLSKRTCVQCHRRHHVVLHKALLELVERRTDTAAAQVMESPEEYVDTIDGSDDHIDTNASSVDNRGKGFLPIVPVYVRSSCKSMKLFALLDCGSNASLISRHAADCLQLKGPNRRLTIGSVTRDEEPQWATSVSFKLSGMDSHQKAVVVPQAWVVDHINVTGQYYPRRNDGDVIWSHLRGLGITDAPTVDLIIGTNVPQAFTHMDTRIGPEGSPVGILGHLGWSLIGVNAFENLDVDDTLLNCNLAAVDQMELTDAVERFWSTEQFGCQFQFDRPTSVDDQKAMRRLENSIRKVDGRYELELLWADDDSELPCNRTMVMRRFRILESMLIKNESLRTAYQEIHSGYIEKGYMRRLTEEERAARTRRTFFVPHYPHVSQHKKVRSVNDCKARYKGVSLNDHLIAGPQLTSSLYGVFTRGRFGPVFVKGDIDEMFYRTLTTKKDQDSLRVLIKRDYTQPGPPDEYVMCVHIFGAKSSPCVASYALQQTARDCLGKFSPDVIRSVSRDFYVDDFLRAFQSETEAIRMCTQVREIVSTGGFRLRKWESTHPSVVAALDPSVIPVQTEVDLNLDKSEEVFTRTLGIYHSLSKDVFTFKTSLSTDKVQYTKRGLLSALCTIFDHVGFLLPFSIILRLLLQTLWEQGLSWDEEVKAEDRAEWQRWMNEMIDYLPKFELRRCIWPETAKPVRFELHTFSDASEKAYAAVTYIRTILENGECHCTLLLARARIAPINKKRLNLPRLELQAAVLGVREAMALKGELEVSIPVQYFWLDSKIVLQSIRNESKRFKTFEANRLAEIHASTHPSQFRFVPGPLNPADDATRGVSLRELTNPGHRWTSGPEFLRMEESSWPVQDDFGSVPDNSDLFQINVTSVTLQNPIDCGRYSNMSRLLRVTAYCLRAARNFLSVLRKSKKTEGHLNGEENSDAVQFWIKSAQRDAFAGEVEAIQCGRDVQRSSRLRDLTPFLDENGILRMKGRLMNSNLPYDTRHPILLPHEHPFTKLLASQVHRNLHHFGVEYTIAELRKKYWVTNVRQLVKKVIFECILCYRRRVQPCTPVMGQLPAGRTSETYPFSTTGIDYFGHFYVKIGRRREKRWVCLFTCLTTRAIHLELCGGLSTDRFIMALRRFTARRGQPTEFWTDNGTNFVGADRELKEAIRTWNSDPLLTNHLFLNGTKWNFTSPKCPHAGGAWERLVRSCKTAINAVLNEQCPHEDTFSTVLCEVEATLNSRPLTANSSDPNDLSALTPNHFLLSRASVYKPTVVYDSDRLSRKRWRVTQHYAEQIWRRFRREYLPTLNITRKWRKQEPNLSVGDVVLVVDEEAPRGCWQLGRILKTVPGTDGNVRKVEVRTVSGVYTRPAHKICLLEGQSD